jgi:hypothetical protein
MQAVRGEQLNLKGVAAVIVLLCVLLATTADVAYAQAVTIATDRPVYNAGDAVTVSFNLPYLVTIPSLMVAVTLYFDTPVGTVSLSGSYDQSPHTVRVTDVTVTRGTYTVRIVATWSPPSGSPFQRTASTTFAVQGPAFDFSLGVSPSSQTVEQGGYAMYKILLTYSSASYSGTTISVDLSGLGPGMTWQSTSSGDLRVSTSSTTPSGTYTFVVVGYAQGVTRQATASLTVVPKAPAFDFSVSVSPSSQTLGIGQTTSYSVAVNLASGSASTVALSLSGLPSGATCSFAPQTGTPSFSSTLTLNAGSASSKGSYTITVIATGGGVSKTTTATLIVADAPDFTLDVSPTTASVKQGQKTTFNIAVTPTGGFDGVVALSMSGLPSGATPSFVVPSGKPPFTTTLTIDVSVPTPEGSYQPSVDASGAGKSHSSKLTLNIEKKPKQASTLSISQPNQQGDTITVTGQLSTPRPATITLTFNGPDGSTLTRTVPTSSSGTYSQSLKLTPTGTWTVLASWEGDDDYLGATSDTLSFNVVNNPFNTLLGLIPGGMFGLLGIIALVTIVAIALLLRSGRTPHQPAATYQEFQTVQGSSVTPTGTAFCQQCGQKIPEQTRFCARCGTEQHA